MCTPLSEIVFRVTLMISERLIGISVGRKSIPCSNKFKKLCVLSFPFGDPGCIRTDQSLKSPALNLFTPKFLQTCSIKKPFFSRTDYSHILEGT